MLIQRGQPAAEAAARRHVVEAEGAGDMAATEGDGVVRGGELLHGDEGGADQIGLCSTSPGLICAWGWCRRPCNQRRDR
jgi:hypothetical protein